jgi:hypothetical protein
MTYISPADALWADSQNRRGRRASAVASPPFWFVGCLSLLTITLQRRRVSRSCLLWSRCVLPLPRNIAAGFLLDHGQTLHTDTLAE